MFKKVQNRILMLNMVMVSTVVIVVFLVIFVTTYARIRNDNLVKLGYGATIVGLCPTVLT